MRRGFTLVEMLVVMAITAVLMGLILIPLGQAHNLTARANAMVAAQDDLRGAMRRITREVSQAMFVFETRPLNLWHYDQYLVSRDQPGPTAGAAPEPYTVRDGMLVFVLPRHRYYCAAFNHYLEDADFPGADPSLIAIDACPRLLPDGTPHATPIELRPLQPLQPEPVWISYFVGLKEPGYPDDFPVPFQETFPPGAAAAPGPRWISPFFPGLTGNFENPYVLFRAEFAPPNPDPPSPLANFTFDSTPLGPPNPNFFYDDGFRDAWRVRSIPVTRAAATDQVQLTRFSDGRWRPLPMTRFAASPVENDAAVPNRRAAVLQFEGPELSAIPPEEYRTRHGHWTGLFNTGDRAIPAELRLSNSGDPNDPVGNFRFGPRIQVFRGDLRVFDSDNTADASLRQRLIAYDASRGVVRFALPRGHHETDTANPSHPDEDLEAHSLTLGRHPETFALIGSLLPRTAAHPITGAAIPLPGDLAEQPAPLGELTPEPVLPSAFGSAWLYLQSLGVPDAENPTRVVPFSETVSRVNMSSGAGMPLRRAGWTGVGDGLNRWVAPSDLRWNEYTIDYRTGLLTFSEADPSLAFAGPGEAEEVWVKYQFQTNTSEDVVRVSYATREVITINLGLVQYSPATREALPVHLTQRVHVRNMTR